MKGLLEDFKGNNARIKNMEDYVHKDELLSKKRQLLAMSEKIETLEIKLNDC